MSQSQADATAEPAKSSGSSLTKNAIGVFGICFFVIAAAAPIAGMTGLVPSILVIGNGAAAPGTFLVAGLIFALFSVGYAAMSNHVVHTGAFFAYIGRGLGIRWGVSSAFVTVMSYCLVQTAVYGYLGAILAGTFPSSVPWWAWSLIAVALVQVLGLLHVEFGAKLLGLLLVLEVGSMVLTAIAVFARGGGPDGIDMGASFSPSAIMNGAPGIAFAFAFAGFIGFEATAIYGEESRNPRRTVPRATYLAVGIITGLFAVVSFGMVSGIGHAHVADETLRLTTVDNVPLADPSQVLFHIADVYVGSWLPELMKWLLISSAFACVLAFHNSATRYFFAMGRAQLLPQAFGRANGRGVPANASFLQTAVAVLVIAAFALLGLDPVINLFYWFAITAIVALTFVQAIVSIAVIVYFRRTGEDSRTWNVLIAPALSLVAMIWILYLLLSRFGLISGTAGTSLAAWHMSATGWALALSPLIVFVAAMLYSTITAKRRPSDEMLREFVS
ncbi:APC family permease [Streptomyces zhihengii]|uniref:APC family permease n=1 Tax=Streptomyces zhihengii TaxID=1818004 RepID=A0ABS2V578_9ACTN|nr:APC family permease [Streptomyces zhihengii]MBM9624624.1 APC family permease [Streptomyces zhihengii]